MRKFIFYSLLFMVLFATYHLPYTINHIPLTIPTVQAHDKAQPHFFKVNGVYIDHYPITATSLPDFVLPQEIDSIPLMVNQQVNFEIEKNNIPLTTKQSGDDTFLMDFGDGQTAIGVSTQHIYSQIGSYILTISVKPLFAQKEVVFDQVLVNVVPDKNYQLPKVVIKVNGNLVNGTDSVKFSTPVKLDGTDSKNQIVNYIWDLGDGQSSDQSKLEHTYADYNYAANVLLRVKDEKGFIADTSIRLENNEKVDGVVVANNSSKDGLDQRKIMLILVIGSFVAAFIIFSRFKLKIPN